MKKTDRVFIILSDVEISTGGSQDDFPHSEYLSEFFQKFNEGKYSDVEVDLVFNGDTFDFLKTGINNKYPHIIDENVALKKFNLIADAHPKFFEGIEKFLDYHHRPRRVHFITGNHDPELHFPAIQNEIISLCGGSGQIFFPGYELKVGDLHIEHGSQHDSLFHVPLDKPFIKHKGKNILNLPWASVTLLNVFIPLHGELHDLDRIKPKMMIVEKIPELKEWLLSNLWRYWTKDYMRWYWNTEDPLKRITWTMVKEAFRRSISFNPEVEMGEHFLDRMVKEKGVKTYVLGHMHEPRMWSYGDRKVIQSGCFRHEFMLGNREGEYSLIPKSYVEVNFSRNKVTTSNLVEISGPVVEKEYYPKPLSQYVPLIREKLAPPEVRLKDKLDIEAQEAKEESSKGSS